MKIALGILLNSLPILLMIGMIPYVQNDYLLTLLFVLVTALYISIHRKKQDFLAFSVGLVGMTISEYLFVKTGVETFERTSLFGIMPLWLPVLWGCGFVVIKRVVTLLSR
ncbi:DUF2878 family protein [Patescibacteria group bacterium]|nr:DUF2878 family protein [Patescibacteria group bacterium]MBU2158955.1 DUF2878 family protein [Patescibacteria group bacterium]MBU2220723.1 DUF2878 family protein [Patescibacteria group bacterium]